MAEKTRRAYGSDVGELAAWAAARASRPSEVDYRLLRRYAARLGGGAGEGARRALSPPTVARKFASIRAFFRQMVERGELEQNPADLVSHARRRAPLPKALRTDEVDAAARPHAGAHAARGARPRDARADLLLRAALRGGREPGRRRPRLRRRGAAGARQGLQDPDRPGRRAGPAGARALPGTGAPGPGLQTPDGAGPVPLQAGPPPVALGRAAPAADLAAPRGPVRRTPRRTPCGTPSPPTCSRAAPTCARSRSCWATRASRRPRSTLG